MDTKRAKNLLGFKPLTSLEQGIKETMAWYKNNKDDLKKDIMFSMKTKNENPY